MSITFVIDDSDDVDDEPARTFLSIVDYIFLMYSRWSIRFAFESYLVHINTHNSFSYMDVCVFPHARIFAVICSVLMCERCVLFSHPAGAYLHSASQSHQTDIYTNMYTHCGKRVHKYYVHDRMYARINSPAPQRTRELCVRSCECNSKIRPTCCSSRTKWELGGWHPSKCTMYPI